MVQKTIIYQPARQGGEGGKGFNNSFGRTWPIFDAQKERALVVKRKEKVCKYKAKSSPGTKVS